MTQDEAAYQVLSGTVISSLVVVGNFRLLFELNLLKKTANRMKMSVL
ncbi:hypothetical protein [Photorhabdus antumapuensis]|nr:hypothetical protein [Photorhabdus antumapuensis]MCA6223013.1 hypothetical protein [Photorhabdus antumapuensis]